MKRTLLFALMALTFAACKKEDTTPDPGPLAPGTWKSDTYWNVRENAWLPVADSSGLSSNITFRNNGTLEQINSSGNKATINWQRVTNKPDDVPADAYLLEILPDVRTLPDGVSMRSFLLISFNSADEITVTPYHLPEVRAFINTIPPVRYKRQ